MQKRNCGDCNARGFLYQSRGGMRRLPMGTQWAHFDRARHSDRVARRERLQRPASLDGSSAIARERTTLHSKFATSKRRWLAYAVPGFETSQEDLSYPPWKEAFIHPNSGLGTVVQIASSIYGYPSVAEYTVPVSHDKMPHRRCARNTEWWRVAMDTTAPPRNVRVSSVALSVDDHDRANTLFATVLEGAATELDVHRTRYSWPSGSIEVTSRGSRGISALFFDADTNSVAVDKFTIGSTPFIERPAAH